MKSDRVRREKKSVVSNARKEPLKSCGCQKGTLWMSSSLEIPVLDWQLDEKNLIHIFDTENNVSVWGWMSWGLSRVDE